MRGNALLIWPGDFEEASEGSDFSGRLNGYGLGPSIANAVTAGIFTTPPMKKAGCPGCKAGAVFFGILADDTSPAGLAACGAAARVKSGKNRPSGV